MLVNWSSFQNAPRIKIDPKPFEKFIQPLTNEKYPMKWLYQIGDHPIMRQWTCLAAWTVLRTVLYTYCKYQGTFGFHYLEKALESGQPVITCANHTSTLDDPLIWGHLPFDWILKGKVRYSLGATELLFTNHLQAFLMRASQTLPCTRGHGLSQLDEAVKILAHRQWVHIYPEGRVHVPHQIMWNTENHVIHRPILPLKWGLAHLVLSCFQYSGKVPIVIPMIHRGMENVRPLYSRTKPFQPVSIHYGPAVKDLDGLVASFNDSMKNDEIEKERIKEEARKKIMERVEKAMLDLYKTTEIE